MKTSAGDRDYVASILLRDNYLDDQSVTMQTQKCIYGWSGVRMTDSIGQSNKQCLCTHRHLQHIAELLVGLLAGVTRSHKA